MTQRTHKQEEQNIKDLFEQLARSQSEEIERRQPARLARLQTRIAERGYESDLDVDDIFEASQREPQTP